MWWINLLLLCGAGHWGREHDVEGEGLELPPPDSGSAADGTNAAGAGAATAAGDNNNNDSEGSNESKRNFGTNDDDDDDDVRQAVTVTLRRSEVTSTLWPCIFAVAGAMGTEGASDEDTGSASSSKALRRHGLSSKMHLLCGRTHLELFPDDLRKWGLTDNDDDDDRRSSSRIKSGSESSESSGLVGRRRRAPCASTTTTCRSAWPAPTPWFTCLCAQRRWGGAATTVGSARAASGERSTRRSGR